MHTNKNNY